MTSVRASADVFCEFSGAVDALAEYFREHQQVVGLDVPLRGLGLPTFLRLRRNVVVAAAVEPDRTDPRPDGHDALRFVWIPTHRVPFLPVLQGFLRVRPAGDHRTRVILEGAYEPPLGIAGRIVDALLGRRIAALTAQTLLADLKRSLELDDLSWRDSLAFAGYEANLRSERATDVGIPLHGAVSVRRHGSYVAVHLLLEGSLDETPLATLEAGDRFFGKRASLKLLADVVDIGAN